MLYILFALAALSFLYARQSIPYFHLYVRLYLSSPSLRICAFMLTLGQSFA